MKSPTPPLTLKKIKNNGTPYKMYMYCDHTLPLSLLLCSPLPPRVIKSYPPSELHVSSLIIGQTCQLLWSQHELAPLTNSFCVVVTFLLQISMFSVQLSLAFINSLQSVL